MARRLIPAHMSVRPIRAVKVCDRSEEASQLLVEELNSQDVNAEVCPFDQLETAARKADIISCATMATEPLIKGEWLQPGTHLDLVGSFTPTMRETDNTAMKNSSVFVDVRAGALVETGDLIIPIKEGAITEESILGEFTELCSGKHTGRAELPDPANAVTIFKAVGDSREDLASAILAYQRTFQAG
jgi:ornithine cyclodeaminase